jgi:pimeloyl-ACP methyl ester carboxylesterase
VPERIVIANGVEICTEDFGATADPTVVLVNGATSSMLRYDASFCRRLAAGGRHVIRFDNRDTGRSVTCPPGAPDYTAEDMADDVAGVLDAYGVERGDLVGMSMGGMILQEFALRHPERARTLTLIMSTPDPTTIPAAVTGTLAPDALPGPAPAVMELIKTPQAVDWSDSDAVIDNILATRRTLVGTRFPFDEEGQRALARAEVARARNIQSAANHALAIARTPPWRIRLAEVSVPTLVIHGTEDPILPFPHGQALAAEIPGARLEAMDGVGHELPEGEWDHVIGVVLAHTAAAAASKPGGPPRRRAYEPELDPIDVEPTDNSGGALVDLDRVQQAEDDYRRRQPKDTKPL